MPIDQPVLAVGAVLVRHQQVLLVKRGKPPNENLWAIPGGKVRPGESLVQAVERELLEETGVCAQAIAPVYIVEHIDQTDAALQFHYVIIDFVMRYISGSAMANDDAADAGWFDLHKLHQRSDIEHKTAVFLQQWWPNMPHLQTWKI